MANPIGMEQLTKKNEKKDTLKTPEQPSYIYI